MQILKSGIVLFFCVSIGIALPPFAEAAESKKPKASANVAEASDAVAPEDVASSAEGDDSTDANLSDLKRRYQNAIVKIEFTAISNRIETKLNPTKSEIYDSGDEPPHGSGFFISQNEILTNAHVVEEARLGSIRIKSPAAGNAEFKVEVVGVGGSEDMDLALLRLPDYELLRLKTRSGLKTLPTLEFGDSDVVRQGDPVVIFGYPQSSDELKIIQGKVTGRQYLKASKDRFICGHQFIETGPAGVVQPGNSGGPALSSSGKVIGIPSRGSGYGSEQGFLIPANIVMSFLDTIRKNDGGRKSLDLPRLGASLTENFEGTAVWSGAPEECVLYELGVVVRDVTSGSLASKWGLKSEDILVGFANKRTGMSCALDFKGFRVVTGRMRTWPEPSPSAAADDGSTEPAQIHLTELILTCVPGDEVTLWYVRPGEGKIRKMVNTFEFRQVVPVPHLGTFEKPPFVVFGDFVAQDFNSLNVALFDVPDRQVLQGGVLVTSVEPNSLASRRGMALRSRSYYGFNYVYDEYTATQWVIIESVNGKPVKNLAELKSALNACEANFLAKTKAADYNPSRRALLKERYAQIGFRTNTKQGSVVKSNPAFPIDEALETRASTTRIPENATPAPRP